MKTYFVKLPSGTVLRTECLDLWPEAEKLSVSEGKRLLKAEAIDQLKALPGDTIYGVVLSVSRSGMSRKARFFAVVDGEIRNVTGAVGNALDWRHDGADWIRLDGCGMDMLYHTVDSVNHATGRNFQSRAL